MTAASLQALWKCNIDLEERQWQDACASKYRALCAKRSEEHPRQAPQHDLANIRISTRSQRCYFRWDRPTCLTESSLSEHKKTGFAWRVAIAQHTDEAEGAQGRAELVLVVHLTGRRNDKGFLRDWGQYMVKILVTG
jgi:hypothetical protein